jgi:predicted DNA-binding transcriptional regulator YafY
MVSDLIFTISDQTQRVAFTYTNWKGITKQRRAIFFRMFIGANEYHPEPQWLMEGHDLDKEEIRTYSLKDITAIKALPNV